MTLLTIAELLAGEALITPGGPVDRITAVGDEPIVWSRASFDMVVMAPAATREVLAAV
jgi:hypothetical protein